MIDIHSHILPGIDDGAADIEEAVAMCKMAASSGCDAIVATPHQRHPTWWNAEPVKLQILLDKVRKHVGRKIDIYLGAEIRIDKSFAGLLAHLDRSGVTPLADSSYLLLEFQRSRLDVDPLTVVEAARKAGWRPIIAHPEFIKVFEGNLGLVREIVAAGALTQITAMSITADFGPQVQGMVLDLIEADLAHFVASDSHDLHRRPPGLLKAKAAIVSRWGHTVANRLLVENPQAVLEDRTVVAAASRPITR